MIIPVCLFIVKNIFSMDEQPRNTQPAHCVVAYPSQGPMGLNCMDFQWNQTVCVILTVRLDLNLVYYVRVRARLCACMCMHVCVCVSQTRPLKKNPQLYIPEIHLPTNCLRDA